MVTCLWNNDTTWAKITPPTASHSTLGHVVLLSSFIQDKVMNLTSPNVLTCRNVPALYCRVRVDMSRLFHNELTGIGGGVGELHIKLNRTRRKKHVYNPVILTQCSALGYRSHSMRHNSKLRDHLECCDPGLSTPYISTFGFSFC